MGYLGRKAHWQIESSRHAFDLRVRIPRRAEHLYNGSFGVQMFILPWEKIDHHFVAYAGLRPFLSDINIPGDPGIVGDDKTEIPRSLKSAHNLRSCPLHYSYHFTLSHVILPPARIRHHLYRIAMERCAHRLWTDCNPFTMIRNNHGSGTTACHLDNANPLSRARLFATFMFLWNIDILFAFIEREDSRFTEMFQFPHKVGKIRSRFDPKDLAEFFQGKWCLGRLRKSREYSFFQVGNGKLLLGGSEGKTIEQAGRVNFG